jgi:hypothetical protein
VAFGTSHSMVSVATATTFTSGESAGSPGRECDRCEATFTDAGVGQAPSSFFSAVQADGACSAGQTWDIARVIVFTTASATFAGSAIHPLYSGSQTMVAASAQ